MRRRDGRHLTLIRQCQCLACGAEPAEAAHVRYSDAARGKVNPGIGAKPDDCWAVPLCPKCHRFGSQCQHAMNERVWWERHGIDPLEVAERLYAISARGRAAGVSYGWLAEQMRGAVSLARTVMM